MRFAVEAEEVQEKQRRILEFLEENQLGGVLLSQRGNFAWAACGRDNHVVRGAEGGVGHALFTASGGKYLLCDTIEADRLREEEALEEQGFTFIVGPWHSFSVAAEAAKRTNGTLAADSLVGGKETLLLPPAKLAPLRFSLTPQEIKRYRWLGATVAQALEMTAEAIEPGMTEFEIGGVLEHFLADEGVIPGVILIAADSRIARYRHPIPTDNTLKRYAMLVTGSSAFGLQVSATRLVHFGPVPSELAEKHRACCQVDATFNLSTVPGTPIREIFARASQAYADAGFAGEWQKHHQGGATGYTGRDYKATPESKETVQANQAFAWNPSITGTKSEDTVLAGEDGLEILSPASEDWPELTVETRWGTLKRPGILEREA